MALAHDGAESRGVLQIARRVSATIGAGFFGTMAEHLAQALAADCVWIGEFARGPAERVRTLAACLDGLPANFEYSLPGSASECVSLGKPCLCRSGARQRFPHDECLARLRAEACVAVPLGNPNGLPSGLVVAAYRQPVASLQMPKSLLEVFAPRAAAELNRQQEGRQLHESEQRHRAFIARNTDAMWRLEFEQPIPTALPAEEQLRRIKEFGYVAECNDALARLLGREKAEQLIGCRVEELAVKSEPSVREATLQAIRSGYRHTTIGTSFVDPQGQRKYMERSQWGIVEDGMLQRIWGTTRDVTALKRSQLALDASEQRMANLLEAVHAIVVMVDLNGGIAYCNNYLLQLAGWRSADVIGKNWLELMIPAEEHSAMRASLEAARQDSHASNQFESTLLGADGRRWWIAWDSTVLRDSEGKVAATVHVGRDTTGQKTLEAQFRQAQKLEGVGRLAGGIAHDFNNLLTVIIGYCGMLIEKTNRSDRAYVSLTEMRKAAEKGADLTRQLLAFGQRQALMPDGLNLNTLVADTESMLRRLIGDDIELVTNLDPSLGSVCAIAGHMHQVLINLAVNARDAMPRGGKLTISSSNLNVDAHGAGSSQVAPGNYVQLTVTDTGTGMSADVRIQIFEPFFTTKESGKGTGLGLSTVLGIVQQSGGQILVDTEPGKGSSFRILLPRVDPESAPREDSTIVTTLPAGTETILLVEDQDDVRACAAQILRGLGYTVLESDGPAQAIALAQQSGEIHLLLTDVVMPGMSGSSLADLIHVSRAGIKVVLMSGYRHRPEVEEQIAVSGFPSIRKPFTPQALAMKMREILDTR